MAAGKETRRNLASLTAVGGLPFGRLQLHDGFAGIDPTRSPQIRVPIQMKPAVVPEREWVKMNDERTRWVQVFARLKPGYTAATAQGPMQGLFTQIRQHEVTLPGAKDWSQFQRDRFMTMGIPFREGRDFTRADAKKDATGAIVNQKFAKHFFGDQSAVGRHIARRVQPGPQ